MDADREALAEAMQPALGRLAEDVIAAIGAEVAEYARPLTGAFGANVRLGVELALGRFMAEFAGAEPRAPNRAVYVELGRGEFREGRSLDALLSAYRVGARLSWRRIVDVGRAAGVDPEILYEVGEAMFAYIDGLSAESTEGYAAAQSAAAGGRALERRRLVALLLADPPADERVLRAAAESAAWPWPARLAALALDGDDPDALAVRLGVGVLATEDGAGARAGAAGAPAPAGGANVSADAPFPPTDAAPAGRALLALVPDPDAPGRRAQLGRALGDASAALGPTVPPAGAAVSAQRARLARRLQAEGRLPGDLVAAADHLPSLVLHTDPRLTAELAAAALSPLDALTPGAAAKLRETLRAWLDAQGRIEPTAAALGVHPQTVRYRLGQLREQLGDALDDPEGRLALSLALRA